MDVLNKNRRNRYDRVMSRVSNQPRSASKSNSFVTRHDIPSSVRVGAKPSVSNVSSSVFSELPTVLNDFVPESSGKKVSKTFVVKPRKTLKSLDPSKSRPILNPKELNKKPSNNRVPVSAPSVLRANGEKWSETHLRDCLSSRSHSRLKELKNEIHAYHETEKLMRIRSSLFKKCGVVLDDVGNIAADKAVQVEELASIDHGELVTLK
ncbi:unnamed protein product [Arctia plantaginis]|uniref:Uncharacterized protein n=1 Tax=Arctia plantaginis TaxID=874455 RepID=A0A8S1A843_ARCPL|nr:unnamed protein product [Arctia plantaginis]